MQKAEYEMNSCLIACYFIKMKFVDRLTLECCIFNANIVIGCIKKKNFVKLFILEEILLEIHIDLFITIKNLNKFNSLAIKPYSPTIV
jgi:hypothetical protein